MIKYVVFAISGFKITTIEADDFEVDFDTQKVEFRKDNCNIAVFYLSNIAGFKEIEDKNEL